MCIICTQYTLYTEGVVRIVCHSEQSKTQGQVKRLALVGFPFTYFYANWDAAKKNAGWMGIKKNRHASTLQWNQMHILANSTHTDKFANRAHNTYSTIHSRGFNASMLF